MDDLLANAGLLSVYGMGTVFLFLTLLVLLTAAMSALLQRFAPIPAKPESAIAEQALSTLPTESDLRARVAVAAALHHHRRR